MVEFLTGVYLFYMFVSLYFFFMFMFLFLRNHDVLFTYPKAKKKYKVSILIPVFNEQETIENTLNAVLASTYNLTEIIVINDGSTDKTTEIVKAIAKKNRKVRLLNKKNSGKADSLNYGIKNAKGELIGVVDADSFPDKDAIRKMVGFFNDDKVGVVTSAVAVKNTDRFLEKVQAIEYTVIAWTRKLLDFIDCVYVTPGPLSIYRKSILKEIGGFDINNMTEDIEIAWNIIHHGYTTKMCLSAQAETVAPSFYKHWLKQRIRWNVGGFQTIKKYKTDFLKKGSLGSFILPFFVLSLVIGVVGLSIFAYLIIKRIVTSLLLTTYAVKADVALISLQELNLNPTILHFFGFSLFILGIVFVFLALIFMKRDIIKKINIFNLVFYSLIYLTTYPIILIVSIYKYFRGGYTW